MADPVEEFQQYRDELLEALGGREPISVLKENLGAIVELAKGNPEEDLARAPAAGEWSVLETIRHLVDTELVYGVRVRMIVTQDRPVIVGYDQDAWMNRFGKSEISAADLIAQLRALRESNLDVYESLTEEELDRVGLHTERGEESVSYMIELLGGHDIIHLRQIRPKGRGSRSLWDQLVERALSFRGVSEHRSRFADVPALRFGSREFLHLDRSGLVDLRLTRKVIRSNRELLSGQPSTRFRGEGSDWVNFALESNSDLEFVVYLVPLAIEANKP